MTRILLRLLRYVMKCADSSSCVSRAGGGQETGQGSMDEKGADITPIERGRVGTKGGGREGGRRRKLGENAKQEKTPTTETERGGRGDEREQTSKKGVFASVSFSSRCGRSTKFTTYPFKAWSLVQHLRDLRHRGCRIGFHVVQVPLVQVLP